VTVEPVKRKKARVVLSIRKSNVNRLKTQTHTLKHVLELEGYHVEDDQVLVDDCFYDLDSVGVLPKPNKDSPTLKLVVSGNSEAQA